MLSIQYSFIITIVFLLSCSFVTKCEPEDTTFIVNRYERKFEVDYDAGQFMKDGMPFRYISGSIHYFRLPRAYWYDRLRKMRAAGLNAIETYIEWSQHEPTPGVYDFSGDLDVVEFIKIAQSLDLLVILRPGPYICAERDLGGFPSWLFSLYPDIKLRTSDPEYTKSVKKWLDYLMPKIVPLLYGNGGPIIMIQVENEYGSYYACDNNYMIWLRDLYKSHVQGNAVLFTTDGVYWSMVRCGHVQEALITIDFGAGVNVSQAFNVVKSFGQKNGPFVNSEYYTGWLTHWNENFQSVDTESVVKTMKEILDFGNNTSLNLYMFFGGTNFGFTNGANCAESGYSPQLTSYDYNAPITETGDLTEKYFAIKKLIGQYLPLPDMGDIPSVSPKASYGTIKLTKALSLKYVPPSGAVLTEKNPLTFEQMNISYGFVLYKHKLAEEIYADPSHLYVPGLRDRAIVLIDGIPVGILSRSRNIFSTPIIARAGQVLGLFIENQGRVNYGTYINDTKGIACEVLLNGKMLKDWEMLTYPLNNITEIEKLIIDTPKDITGPAFYTGQLVLSVNQSNLQDTYLNLDGWGKGVAFINGFNLGRYWTTTGPQKTLYIPGSKLKPKDNTLTIFELEFKNPKLEATFQSTPDLNSSIPYLGSYKTICQMSCRKPKT